MDSEPQTSYQACNPLGLLGYEGGNRRVRRAVVAVGSLVATASVGAVAWASGSSANEVVPASPQAVSLESENARLRAQLGRLKEENHNLEEQMSKMPHASAFTTDDFADMTVVGEWVSVQYEWESAEQREKAVADQSFIVENNAITGLKVCGPKVAAKCTAERIFATVPRWRTGVWSTLNEVVRNSTGHQVLRPWPTLEENDPTDCSKLQYVQSMEIDSQGVMWVVDVGRKYFASADPADVDNTCPPKMVLIDVPTGQVVDTYVFPDEVAPYTGSFLNDIVIDEANQVGYLSSTGNNLTDLGSLMVFDRKSKSSRRFQDRSTQYNDIGDRIIIHGQDYTDKLHMPSDGIALTPDGSKLYYSPIGNFDLFSLDTAVLRDSSKSDKEVAATVKHIGQKPSNSDGMSMGSNGVLYFGGLTTNSLYSWDPAAGPLSSAKTVVHDDYRLWWIDTFAWANDGSVWVTTNRLNKYFFGGMDFSGASGPNFRIVRIEVGTNSYMSHGSEQVA